ncbi:1,3-beta-glucanosyltransferase [Neolecta irregularis DAH-3]|uniref:1,3-beta-glucanosyltransferase n=1 Tax=Neolecta irregularis (strain DAH-3) TaxID=1198029 RepID=A0A1U7LJK0_NEOID|nr:1,3-beta-glucanosyltransferase [Neolecta irregularis DAH-3]|eukprot:OLL22824.1 1,3-beta-glucanosyltransferase [Neolecta irregularis DAH-3]
MGLLSGFSAALAFSSVASTSISSISIIGTKLFDASGQEFFVQGVAYQQENTNSATIITDPLANAAACHRDAPLMQKLGINTIRTYAIDPTLDHKECMAEFESVGIYVVSDLSQPRASINRDDPLWDTTLFDRYTAVVDALAIYPNVIGFFAGNEVSSNITNSVASAFVKAAIRDTKAYIAQKNYKNLFVGYVWLLMTIRLSVTHWANISPVAMRRIGLTFSVTTFTVGRHLHHLTLTNLKEFQKYPIPSIFSEVGCNLVESARPFTEIEAIYGDQMAPVLSGCIVYMWFQEENDYGLVNVSGDQVTLRQDYTNLQTELAKVNPTRAQKSSYKPSSSLLECPSDATAWPVSNVLPPSPNKDLCSCMIASLSCVVADNVESKDYGTIFGQVCGASSCDGIHANGTTGEYGAYSMCQAKEKLSFALNQYYKKQNYASTACDFNGQAKIQSPKTSGSCKSILSEAGTDGTGKVSSSISASSKGSGSSSGKSAGVVLSFNTIKTALVVAGALGQQNIAKMCAKQDTSEAKNRYALPLWYATEIPRFLKSPSAIARSSFSIAAVLLLSTSVFATLDPIVSKGTKFFYKTSGTQFYIKGVAYQQDLTNATTNVSYVDPLADSAACTRDVPYLKALGVNAVRTYAINPTQDHSTCMQLLDAAGIYVVSDLSEPRNSINRDDPIWNVALFTRYTQVIDSLAPYSNVLAFIGGNEVSNNSTNTDASAFVKAAVRDSKAYLAAKGYRDIPVGYAANDDADIRLDMAQYFACGNTTERVDFYAANIYSWCGTSTFTDSGYQQRTQDFSTYPVPVFFGEFGCNLVQPRPFTEVEVIFGPQMTPVWSGGLAYMWVQEANNYGLVEINGNTVTLLQDYQNYKAELAKINPITVNINAYTPTRLTIDCPASGHSWAASTLLPPTPNQSLCTCMVSSLSCVASSSLSATQVASSFATVCGLVSCAGINANGTTGVYGAYSMCGANDQLSFVFNQYYIAQKKNPSACDFGGAAKLTTPSSVSSNCQSLMGQAKSDGTGAVQATSTDLVAASSGVFT